jgi:hypothetical protein
MTSSATSRAPGQGAGWTSNQNPERDGSSVTVATHWHDLVTAALLGTDRRDPPEPPAGPLGDVVADAVAPTPSARMLVTVAASTAVRRAGLRPHPPTPPLARPDQDERPMVPPAAARRWRAIVAAWPVLEDEWLASVARRRMRLPPDVLVDLLRRHQCDPGRAARVLRLGGPLARWLLDQRPELGPTSTRRRMSSEMDLEELPGLAVPPALLAMLTAPPTDISASIVGGLADGSFGAAHRAVLVNFIARMRPDACAPLVVALRTGDAGPAVSLAHALADLAEHRHRMLEELAS